MIDVSLNLRYRRPLIIEKTKQAYDASSIEVLEGLDPVRKRPGMYIGGTDSKGLHHLVSEVLDNSMDEVVSGHANKVNINLIDSTTIEISDNGRGIPVDKHPKFKLPAVEVILTTLHSGGKFSNKNYQTSGGLHGVGVSVVNALSKKLDLEIARDKKFEIAFPKRLVFPMTLLKLLPDSLFFLIAKKMLK